jgi:hypothetical protein
MNMQKIMCALVSVIVLASCSPSYHLNSEKGILEGTIYSLGNDPFTKLGIQTSDGTMYIVKCTKEIEQALNGKQGKRLKVQYEKIEPTPEGLTLRITNIE